MRKIISSVLLFAFGLSVVSSPCLAEDALLYYILDGSGSMWGRVEGKMKIQVAKEVMSKLVEETPEGVQVGLMVYGHRKKGDCKDIEELIPIGSLNRVDATEKIKRISPKGMTPISDSISKAVDRAKSFENNSTIVLVSDGIETCDKDPCAVTKALKESGVRFVMHVVGFGLKGPEEAQLACVAEAGGGKYFSTKNASELLSSLNQIKQSVVEKKEVILPTATPTHTPTPEPTPEPKTIRQEVKTKSTSIRIKASGPGRIRPVYDSWLTAPYRWRLLEPETGKEKVSFSGNLDEQMVPPGEYQVAWQQTQHKSREVILGEVVTIESGKTTDLMLKTAVKLIVPTWVKEVSYWGISDAESSKELARFSELTPQLVPGGVYDLVWLQAEHKSITAVLKRVEIAVDTLNEIELSTALNPLPADWVPKEVYYWALREADSAKWSARFYGSFDPQLVPAGKYRLIYRRKQHGSTDSDLGTIEIATDKMNEFAINTGVKLIPKAGTEAPYQIKYIELDENNNALQTVRQGGSFDPMPLKPGRYKIQYHQTQHGSSEFTLVESFELPAGSLVEIEM